MPSTSRTNAAPMELPCSNMDPIRIMPDSGEM